MPASAEEGRDVMFRRMAYREPDSVLDIGAGSGTYGKMFRQIAPTPYLIGVEIWPPYVNQYNLTEIYDHVLVQDVRDMWGRLPPRADIVILGDVLEHMPEEDAVRVWHFAKELARDAVYLSIPIVPCPQDAVGGNPHEEHVVSDWTHERVLAAFPGISWHWRGSVVGRYEAVVR